MISVSYLFHSDVDEGKKVFMKKLCRTLNKGILSHNLVLYDLEVTVEPIYEDNLATFISEFYRNKKVSYIIVFVEESASLNLGTVFP